MNGEMKLAQILPEVLNGLAAWVMMALLGIVAFFNLKGNVSVLETNLENLEKKADNMKHVCSGKVDRELMDEKLDRIAEDVSDIKKILNGR